MQSVREPRVRIDFREVRTQHGDTGFLDPYWGAFGAYADFTRAQLIDLLTTGFPVQDHGDDYVMRGMSLYLEGVSVPDAVGVVSATHLDKVTQSQRKYRAIMERNDSRYERDKDLWRHTARLRRIRGAFTAVLADLQLQHNLRAANAWADWAFAHIPAPA